MQWQEVLQQYDRKIKWIPESKNIITNSLSSWLDHKNNNILNYPELVFLQSAQGVRKYITVAKIY